MNRDKAKFISATTTSFESISGLEKACPDTYQLRQKALKTAQAGKELLGGVHNRADLLEAPLKDVTDTLKRILYSHGNISSPPTSPTSSPTQTSQTRVHNTTPTPQQPPASQPVPIASQSEGRAGAVSPLASNIPFTGGTPDTKPRSMTGSYNSYNPQERKDDHHMTTAVGANYSPTGIFRCGYMTKRGGGKKTIGRSSWKKRWFKLSATSLSYWTSDQPNATCQGQIDLQEFVWVQNGPPQKKKNLQHIFHLKTSARVFEIVANDEADKTEWMSTIETIGRMLKIAKDTDSGKAVPTSQYKVTIIRVGDNFLRFSSNVRTGLRRRCWRQRSRCWCRP